MGLQKILSLLEAEDYDVRIHAVKVVANLAAEGTKKHYNVHWRSAIIAFTVLSLLFQVTVIYLTVTRLD